MCHRPPLSTVTRLPRFAPAAVGAERHRVLFTLWEDDDPARWIEIRFLPASRKFELRWGTNEGLEIQADSPEAFFLLRTSPIMIGISCHKLVNGTADYTCVVSAGGTTPAVGTMNVAAPVKPTQIRFGDRTQTSVCPMLWYGGSVDDSTNLNSSQLAASFRSLGMLYAKTVPAVIPPE